MSFAGLQREGHETFSIRSGSDPLQGITLSSHQNNTGLWESRQPLCPILGRAGRIHEKRLGQRVCSFGVLQQHGDTNCTANCLTVRGSMICERRLLPARTVFSCAVRSSAAETCWATRGDDRLMADKTRAERETRVGHNKRFPSFANLENEIQFHFQFDQC